MPVVSLPWAAWYRDERHELTVPENFQVNVLNQRGASPLDSASIAAAIDAPVAGPTLQELAGNGGSVAIAVDDLTRPTRIQDVLVPILDRLVQAGIAQDSILLIVATGSHAALDPIEIQLKFGQAIAERFRIVSHNCREGLTGTGIQYGASELRLNSRFLSADLRIVVGSVLPHSFAGYSGGAKLVLPGLSDLESIRRSHKLIQFGRKISADPNENIFRREAEELVRRIGLHFAVCVVSNDVRETVGVAAGDFVTAHRAASRLAGEVFRTDVNETADVVLLNAYPKDADLIQAANAFLPLKGAKGPLTPEEGLFILTTAAWTGLGTHGVFAPGAGRPVPGPLRHLGGRDLWLYVPSMSTSDVHRQYWSEYRVFNSAEDLQTALSARYPEGARMAVFPTAPMQQIQDLRT